jgi:uncharacterized membrane protein
MYFFAFGQSLWLDEAITANLVKNFSLFDIITQFSPADFHPPLYYIVLKLWTAIFGFSEISLRLPSLIFALITAYFIYKISKNHWASLLFIFNPLIVYYSQEARMYLLVTCLLTTAYYFFVNKKNLLFNLFIFLSFLTFYGSVFLILTFFIYLIFKKQFHWRYLFGFTIALLVLSPLIYLQFQNSRQLLSLVPNWPLVLGQATLKNLLLIPLKFTSGRITFYPKIIYYFVSGLWAAWIFAIFRRRPIYLYFFTLPLILGAAFSIFTPMLSYFRFIYLIPILSLALAESRYRAIALAGFIAFSGVYIFNPRFHREDWKSLSASLPANSTVYMIASLSDPIKYYRPDIKITDYRLPITDYNLLVIPYGESLHSFDHQSHLKSQNYSLQSTQNFREITLEEWSKNQ